MPALHHRIYHQPLICFTPLYTRGNVAVGERALCALRVAERELTDECRLFCVRRWFHRTVEALRSDLIFCVNTGWSGSRFFPGQQMLNTRVIIQINVPCCCCGLWLPQLLLFFFLFGGVGKCGECVCGGLCGMCFPSATATNNSRCLSTTLVQQEGHNHRSNASTD